jgi:hypothetical protein
MPRKTSRIRTKAAPAAPHKSHRNGARPSRGPALTTLTTKTKLGGTMSARNAASGNEYSCAIERNQAGKYSVRIRVIYARDAWTLRVYFLASSFNGAMKKLEESLQILQKNEDRLRFWGLERSDDPNMAGDLLQQFGLHLDRRTEFPRKVAELGAPRERPVPASMLAPMRRILADSMSQPRASAATNATN